MTFITRGITLRDRSSSLLELSFFFIRKWRDDRLAK